MDAIVQLVRNALCCIKDLQLFKDAGIHDPAQLPLPHPLNKTTRLEIVIAITQFYAFASVSRSGWNLILTSRAKLRSVETLLLKLQQQKDKNGNASNNNNNTVTTTATDLLLQKLQNDRVAAQRNLWVGINVFCIGVAFFWLFANSFHVTETSWIGGVPALIHALTIMEIAMIPLLYYMVADTVTLLSKSAVMAYVANILHKCIVTDKNNNTKGVPLAILTDETFALLLDGGWTPFTPINANSSAASENDEDEAKSISKEIANVVSELESWTSDKDNNNNTINALIQSTADRIESRAISTRYEAYREFIYFLLNFVAFYGYMLGILVYYRNEDVDEPLYVRTLKLGMGNADADWTGNFAGDLMWTIEPMIILASPALVNWLTPKRTKLKVD